MRYRSIKIPQKSKGLIAPTRGPPPPMLSLSPDPGGGGDCHHLRDPRGRAPAPRGVPPRRCPEPRPLPPAAVPRRRRPPPLCGRGAPPPVSSSLQGALLSDPEFSLDSKLAVAFLCELLPTSPDGFFVESVCALFQSRRAGGLAATRLVGSHFSVYIFARLSQLIPTNLSPPQLDSPSPLLRRWLCLCIGKLVEGMHPP